jgi:integrase/recombinase XerD
MENYEELSIKALQLAGMGERTQESYTRALRMLSGFYEKGPDQISEKELEDYFLHRRNVTLWSSATLRIAYSGIKFYFQNVLKRDWHIFAYLKAQKERKLPSILDKAEVHQLLECIKTHQNYACLSTIYGCGLRISEALALQVSDIDGKRMMIHVYRGKGARDRYVPMPMDIYQILRRYWVIHRNPIFVFPALGRGHIHAASATKPMDIDSVQGAFRLAKKAAGITKRGVSVHTLRHCYATHLLEAGVNPRIVQRYLGHSRLETTMIYFHLTQKGTEDACRIINDTMKDFRNDSDKRHL